jgi:hypothetical protein
MASVTPVFLHLKPSGIKELAAEAFSRKKSKQIV